METSTSQATASRPDTTAKLSVLILPGFHSSALTQKLIESLPSFVCPRVIDAFPASPLAVYQWLQNNVSIAGDDDPPVPPVVAIGFSAGVVGLAGALVLWQQQGGQVSRLIAIDGWGVPIIGLPVTRISHDRFTHVSTLPLGSGKTNFYADPPVPHLALWGDPEAAQGFSIDSAGAEIPMSAAEYLRRVLHSQWNSAFSWRARS